jgi:hypothetical protein
VALFFYIYILSLCLMEWAINWPRPSVCVVLMSMIKLESGKSKEEEEEEVYYSSLIPKTSRLGRPDLFGIMLEEEAVVWEGSSIVQLLIAIASVILITATMTTLKFIHGSCGFVHS